MKSRYNPILIAIIAFSLCCGLWLVYNRHQVEVRNNTVEMVMDYQALKKMAAWEGANEKDLLAKFKKAGITTLAVYDTTLERLDKSGMVIAVPGRELLQADKLQVRSGVFGSLLTHKNVEADAIYIAEGSSKTAFNEVITDLRLRYGTERVQVVGTNPVILELKGDARILEKVDYETKTPLMQAPLGLSSEEMKEVAAAGFHVAVRPQNYLPVSRTAIESIFTRIAASGARVTTYLPCGLEVVGYPHNEYYMSRLLHDYDIRLGLIEHVTQLQFAKFDGLSNLLEEGQYDAVRVYTIDALENQKLQMPEAMRRWAVSDQERNIRMNYIRPFMKPQAGVDVVELNLQYVRGIKKSVERVGYTLGTASVLQQTGPSNSTNSFAGPYFPAKPLLILVSLGIVAGLVLYLNLLMELQTRWQYGIILVGGVVTALLLYLGRGLLTRQALAFIAASVFPVLSLSVMMDVWEERRPQSSSVPGLVVLITVQLAVAILISLIGATFIASILGDIRFFLEADIYRGVKLTFILPPLLTLLVFCRRYNIFGGTEKVLSLPRQLLKFCRMQISVGSLLILAVFGLIALIFVGRSGHTAGVPVPALEIKLRIFLEEMMYARPREKEFLVGHPAFYLAAYAFYQKAPRVWQLLLVMAAVIGQGSLVQTFCHMRTPVLMSYIRAADGFALGAVLGILLLVVLLILLPYVQKWRRRYLADE